MTSIAGQTCAPFWLLCWPDRPSGRLYFVLRVTQICPHDAKLTATGRVLHGMGIAAALAFTPAMYGLLTAAVALHPRPSTGEPIGNGRVHQMQRSLRYSLPAALLLDVCGRLLAACLLLLPAPAVAFADIVRRLSTYVVSRPAREVLFTVVTREEKYKAKVTPTAKQSDSQGFLNFQK